MARRIWLGKDDDAWNLRVWLRAVVPGWGQWYRGELWRGLAYAILFWALLLVSLATIGTTGGVVCLTLALCVQVSAIIDLLVRSGQVTFQGRVEMAVIAITMLALVYIPLGYLVAGQVTIQRMVAPVGPFSAGDVLWFLRPSGVRPGDVVLYNIPQRRIELRFHYNFEVGGDRIDRVIAGPGSRVQYREGKLLVDGQPSEWESLQAVAIRPNWELVVPPDNFFIVPSTIGAPPEFQQSAGLAKAWQSLCLVPAARIQGRAWIVGYPPEHRRRLR